MQAPTQSPSRCCSAGIQARCAAIDRDRLGAGTRPGALEVAEERKESWQLGQRAFVENSRSLFKHSDAGAERVRPRPRFLSTAGNRGRRSRPLELRSGGYRLPALANANANANGVWRDGI